MAPYFMAFFGLIFLSFFERYRLLLNGRLPLVVAFLFMVAFTGLRGDVGTDTSSYLNIFKAINVYEVILEPCFYYLNKLTYFFGFDFEAFLIIVSIISLFFYFYSLYKFLGVGLVLAAFLIIYSDTYMYFNLSGLRQGLALSVVMLAGYYALHQKFLAFAFLVLLATLFHKTALVAFLYWPLMNFDFSRYLNFFSFSILIFLGVGWFSLSGEVVSILERVVNFKGAEMYLSESYNQFSMEAYLNGLIRRVYPLFFVFLIFRFNLTDLFLKKLFSVYSFGFLFYLLNYPVLQDVTVRLSSYFLIFESVLVVYMFSKIQHVSNRLIFILVVLFVLLYKLFSYANNPDYNYVVFSIF
ncbi:EpsG family protein [Pseudoalteromonas piscicida]|uniref:EpsG family protein n=1 Tax=Pseudoalteromonas piscicida TaxID=43662 RepID=A0ABM6NJI7_PSEO7|nr:EpsG family protein [Pseudoalteromonas piscicida]ATD08972.1 hypothetical protein PPIS_a4330 [Pseudoalteromonas piscicida]WPU30947.1 EpsG family protein [Pseudoalteromonas piscicida]